MQKELEKIYRINGDILATLMISDEVGWDGLKEVNIHRVIYISSVLYSFREGKKENPFITDYNFIISLRGPYSNEVAHSLIYLRTQKYIEFNSEKELVINKERVNKLELKKLPKFKEKKDWLETIIYIIGIYGEDKIYDFVFRDPEYQDNVQRNSLTNLNLRAGNETYKSLIDMKKVFENTLGEKARGLNNKEYLELYFQYIFSKILKGDLN